LSFSVVSQLLLSFPQVAMSWNWTAATAIRRQAPWPSYSYSRPWKKEYKYTQEAEWKCLGCGEGNWLSRAQCRGCKSAKGSGATRHRVESLSLLDALQTTLDNLGDNPLLDEIRQKLVADIKKLEKKTTDNRSLAKQLFTLEGWVEREEKRITASEEQLVADKLLLVERKADYQIELAKIISLKEAIVKEAEFKDPGLEEEQKMETDNNVPDLQSKELDIRRKMAMKKDDKGAAYGAKRMKEMEKEADGYRDKIASAKRPKTDAEPKTETAAAASAQSTS
jgi:hypothetical protein